MPLQAQAAPRAPAFRRAPTPFRARLRVENLLEVRDCRYTADLLTTRPPKEPVNARYQVVSEDGVQAWDEQLISFSPEGEAKFRFTVKDTASGELDLSIWIPGCGKAQLRFHRYSRADREAFKKAYGTYGKASSSSSSNASPEGSRPGAKVFDSAKAFRASAKWFGIDISCWEGMALQASRKYFGCVPPCYSS